MPSSRSPASAEVRRHVLDFYWGVWSELGVSGWGRTHDRWAIDPEPLIAFSPPILAADARLRDEVIDWCAENWRHISAVRLRHLVKANGGSDSNEWGTFSATVNGSSGASRWPFPTTPRSFARTGRSSLRPLSDASMVYLRMRAIFGLSARTEVLRRFLVAGGRATSTELAARTNYAKRNVADACDGLVRAGLLRSQLVGNRLYFDLVDPGALATFIGPSAPTRPDWPPLLRVVNSLFNWSESMRRTTGRVAVVTTHAVANEVCVDLQELGVASPVTVAGEAFLPVWDEWVVSMTAALASGDWPTRLPAH